MKPVRPSFTLVTLSVASLLAFAVPQGAQCQSGSRANAQALVEEAKKSEYERKMAAKQTVADRLGEDLKKAKHEIDDLEKSVNKVSGATAEATGELGKLGAEKKRLTRDLELANLRIDAEKLKAEGLKLLGIAHAKSREALTKRTEEIELRTSLVSAEMGALAGKSPAEPASSGSKKNRSKQGSTLTELRKQLSKAEQATINASSNARQAMDAAAHKVQQADAAAAKAEKRRAELAQENS
jgi:tetrahydromethanopterin S-methyltransferase subunit G